MINKIIIKNRASYDQNGVTLIDLKRVNYFYGTNGSGKTIFSNTLKNFEKHPECHLSWNSSVEMKKVVYNKEFVEENFHHNGNIKGIFTLGKESHDIQEDIRLKTAEINKINDEQIKLNETLSQKNDEKSQNETEYESKCWKLKVRYDEHFEEAFKGYRAVKTKFKDKCKLESINAEDLKTLEELNLLSSRIFGNIKERINAMVKIESGEISSLINDSILGNRIIGREDIDIADLISKLNISDWVKQGHSHFRLTEGICPFCQQKTAVGFQEKLNEYFNDTYNEQIEKLKGVILKYNASVDGIINKIDALIILDNEYIDSEILKSQRTLLNTKHDSNKNTLSRKMSEPSGSIKLETIDDEIKVINDLIDVANGEIRRHNSLIDNFDQEKKKLISQIWKFITDENKDDHKSYVEKDYNFEKAITGLTSNITSKNEKRKHLILDVERLESQITSIIPSINEMNRLLRSFNFTNFKIAETAVKGNYRIIRQDGEDAKRTLSEGEKTFVTFLYFIHLLNGSNDNSRITENKVVVIDDPISSLDSNILFIVSNLIRRLIEDIRNQRGNIKQIFILTHNIYFHKEVTFNKGKGHNKLSDETFWILRKINNVSEIQSYDFNPIKTSYELLWQEMQSARERSSSTVQNLIRKIIENYFKIYGNYSEEDIIDKFHDDEQVTCRALLSWINDGSHFTNDDLYVECSTDTVEKYLSIFEKIFLVTGHHAHYKMMMGIEDKTAEEQLEQSAS